MKKTIPDHPYRVNQPVAGGCSIVHRGSTGSNRSGLLRLRGQGFGNGPVGTVQVGSLSAPVARWQDDLIECYVPEGTPLGSDRRLRCYINSGCAAKCFAQRASSRIGSWTI